LIGEKSPWLGTHCLDPNTPSVNFGIVGELAELAPELLKKFPEPRLPAA
jgi:hypothetical protein